MLPIVTGIYEDLSRYSFGHYLIYLHGCLFSYENRYLIVLDDMWDTKPWEIIQHIVHENGLKSRIITTTRRFDVAEQVGGCYRLKHLTHESSKILFFGRIFGSGGKCPTKFSEISENILKKCAGVPLAIIATSKTLLANNSEDIKEWCHVSDSLGSGLGSSHGMDTIRKTQFLSYYDLPSQLKVCLLYLSIFPEEYKIRRDRLIWRWIAEDFVQHGEEDQSLFELGESYFNELVNRNLIQPIPANDEGTSWACAVHDMVLDLICLLSREEGFVTTVLGDSKQSTPDDVSKVRRLALHTRNEQHNYGDNMDVAQPQLRSLDAMGCPTHMIPSVSRFLLLRVLDLESCRSIEGYDLKHLGKLLLLRFLGLSNTFVRELPEEIGNLKFLQTLELERSGVEELPASMGGLRGLMCLNADWTTSVPDWIGKLTSLQQLVMYPSFGDENSARWFAKELGNLRELRVLRFLIKTRDEGQLRDLLESLSNLKKVKVLHFHYYGVQLNNRAVLLEPTEFALSKTLCFLELHLLEFSRRPSWINPQDLPHLRHLWLMVFDAGKQDLGILGGFPELRHLHLLIANTERGDIITCDGSAFLNLKFCSITKPLLFVYGAMPRLEVLDFHFDVRFLMGACHNFDFDFGMGNLHSLQRVIVQIRCVSAFPEEVAKAEAAVRDAIHLHTNRPTLEISLFGQRMETFYADLNQNTEKVVSTY
jgi:disease resistance protein RPM1